MEPPGRILAILSNLLCFVPVFIVLLILGFIKGIVLFPIICFIITFGNSAVILYLWPIHFFYTCYCIFSSKQFGPILKILLCIFVLLVLIPWPPIGIFCSIVGGAAFGLLGPMFATVKAVGEGKTDKYLHIFIDGTWDIVKGSLSAVRDFGDVLYHSYFSFMDDLRHQPPLEEKSYDIWLFYLPLTVIAGVLGIVIDLVVITCISICKSPFMLFKGWHRLFQDCIGREGPFLEAMCVPFAGLAILLWPLTVAAALVISIISSVFLGGYAAVVVYQESSFSLGLRYIVASLSIYDEYSNDILDMAEGSIFPRPQYREKGVAGSTPRAFSRPTAFHNQPSRVNSTRPPILDLKPLELFDSLITGSQLYGEALVLEGVISLKDIEDAKSNKDKEIISIGLPTYTILQALLLSVKSNSPGILIKNNMEITTSNRPKDKFFDWFLNPFLIIKDQIKAENLSETEEEYLGKLVLFSDDSERVKNSNTSTGPEPESDLRRAELDALARRLRGVTKSISRYPTFRRRFDGSIKVVLEELAKKKESVGSLPVPRSSIFSRIFNITRNHGFDEEAQTVVG